MRWLWIDHFVEFISGRRATAVKRVTAAEEVIDGYLPGYPMYPPSVMVEGLAQTGGLLVAENSQFAERVVLAKLGRAAFHRAARPGDELIYSAEAQDINPHGAFVRGEVRVGDELVAEVDLVFAHLDDRFPPSLFEDRDLLMMLHVYRLYEVAVDQQGQKLQMPEHLRRAAQEMTHGE